MRAFCLRINIFALPSFALICYAESVLSAFVILLCAFLHEIGHFTAVMLCRARVRELYIEPMGAKIVYDGEHTSYRDDILISWGGVLFNLIFCVAGCVMFAFLKNEYVLLFIASNLALAATNALPVSFLDGGTALYAFLCTKNDIDRAYAVSKVFDKLGRAAMISADIFALTVSNFNIGFCVLVLVQAVTLIAD